MSSKNHKLGFMLILALTFFFYFEAYAIVETSQTDKLAIEGFWSGVLGVLSLITAGALDSIIPLVLGIALGIIGVVATIRALKRIKKEPEIRKGKGWAIVGLILSLICTIYLALIFLIISLLKTQEEII